MKNKGILLPVSSLPGHHGVGDMGENAFEFIRWLNKRNFNYWQILPINPLGPGWSPYMTTCSEAIDFRYISLDDLYKDGLLEKPARKFHPNSNKALYVEAGEFKKRILKKAYKNFKKSHFDELLKFVKSQKWIIRYAFFNIFYEENNLKAWNEWPKDEIFYLENHKKDNKIPTKYKDKFYYLVFEQLIAYKQWKKLIKYAHKFDIKIIGDLPFYVGYNSSDCWGNKKVFNLDENFIPTTVAGCPPDGFSEDGQLWGNPTFNFEVMKKDNYKFYVNRLGAISKLCDIVRLDHFRAFDAYYAIPAGAKNARIGEWIDGPAYGLFDAFFKKYPKANIIAEDLGFMTERVYALRDHYHFPGMNILQNTFFEPQTKDQDDMIMYTGTHDNNTIKYWFDNLDNEGKEKLKTIVNADPNKNLLEEYMRFVFRKASKLTIVPMQDYLLLDNSTRLNSPGSFGSPNWEWKLIKLPNVIKNY